MLVVSRLLAAVLGALGLALVIYGAWGGVWPISIQLIAGILLLVYAAVRWRSLGGGRGASGGRAKGTPRA